MSAGLLKRMSMVVGVGKSGDKSVDKRVFLCIERWMNCGYRLVFRNKFINQQVSDVTSPYITVDQSNYLILNY